jgi:hypothetical protein
MFVYLVFRTPTAIHITKPRCMSIPETTSMRPLKKLRQLKIPILASERNIFNRVTPLISYDAGSGTWFDFI